MGSAVDYQAILSERFPVGKRIEGPVSLEIGEVKILFESEWVMFAEVKFVRHETGTFYAAKSMPILPDCVLTIPVCDDGRLVLVVPFRPGVCNWKWEFPQERHEGGSDEEEANRCVVEEVGIVGKLSSVEVLSRFPSYPDRSNEIVHAFLVKGAFNFDLLTDTNEIHRIGAFTIPEIFQMIQDGDIVDPVTTTVLMKYLIQAERVLITE